jgi:ureidoacrylate peracid hydrolase
MGLIAHTCVEATVRYAAELGYEVTVVKDATASYSDDLPPDRFSSFRARR